MVSVEIFEGRNGGLTPGIGLRIVYRIASTTQARERSCGRSGRASMVHIKGYGSPVPSLDDANWGLLFEEFRGSNSIVALRSPWAIARRCDTLPLTHRSRTVLRARPAKSDKCRGSLEPCAQP
jgi:hypothetical protein